MIEYDGEEFDSPIEIAEKHYPVVFRGGRLYSVLTVESIKADAITAAKIDIKSFMRDMQKEMKCLNFEILRKINEKEMKKKYYKYLFCYIYFDKNLDEGNGYRTLDIPSKLLSPKYINAQVKIIEAELNSTVILTSAQRLHRSHGV